MPNWCNNQVTFSGTTEDINNIIEFVEGDVGRRRLVWLA